MLLYRPLLSAYQRTDSAPASRFIIRELADPSLHAEPDELLAALAAKRGLSPSIRASLLHAQVALRERALRARLTTRDQAREMGGVWTVARGSREQLAVTLSTTPTSKLRRAAGKIVETLALSLLKSAKNEDRALVFAALGDFGTDLAAEPLAQELSAGPMPHAAALGIGELGIEAGESLLFPAVQARGLVQSAQWLGLALSRLACERTLPLLTRLASAKEPEAREQAAWAMGFFSGVDLTPVLEAFDGESDRFVKLNLVRSLGRLGGLADKVRLSDYYIPSDPEVLRVAVIRACGYARATDVVPFLEKVITSGGPEEVAEALQALVWLGVSEKHHLDAARTAATSDNKRMALAGLLALSIWSPKEAFSHVVNVFSGAASSDWFLCAYALRYIRTEQTVPLLAQLLKVAHGTELEEFAVSALCRHLTEPLALEILFSIARSRPSPVVMHRMMYDIAHHLPERQRAQTAEQIRHILVPELPPPLVGPVLLALGSLGTKEDLPCLARYVRGETALAAINGIELMMDPAAEEVLEPVTLEGDSQIRAAALAALFHLGCTKSMGSLENLISTAADVSVAVNCLLEIALSVRLIRAIGALARLHGALEEGAKSLPETDVPPTDLSSPSEMPFVLRSSRDLQKVVVPRPRTVTAKHQLPSLRRPPPSSASADLYRELGRHLGDTGSQRCLGNRLSLWVAGLITIGCLVTGLWFKASGFQSVRVDSERSPHSGRAPTLCKVGADPGEGIISPGDTVEGTPDHPLKLVTPIQENSLTLKGKLTVTDLSVSGQELPSVQFGGKLLGGTVDVDFPRGVAQIKIEGARTTVEVIRGSSRLEMKESTFRLSVGSGTARILRGVIVMKSLSAGQSGEFLDGNPMGRIEEGAASPVPRERPR